MQQTADVDANVTKDQDVDVDSETTLVSGLSYFSYSVVAIAGVQAVADAVADATIAVSGLSSCSSSVADSAETAVVLTVADVDVAATICAANLS